MEMEKQQSNSIAVSGNQGLEKTLATCSQSHVQTTYKLIQFRNLTGTGWEYIIVLIFASHGLLQFYVVFNSCKQRIYGVDLNLANS
jgi:hypothetical protein